VYGYSKFLFDQLVRQCLPGASAQIAGFRYFNVYGPNEAHKGRMASVAYHAYHQLLASGKVKLFVGSGGYGNGEQKRDFVYVEDVVDVNLWFLEHRAASGVYNCGTGRAQTFQRARRGGDQRRAGHATHGQGHDAQRPHRIRAVPRRAVEKYQSFTQADLSRLRAAGYSAAFRPVEQGVAAYVDELQKK
jgi:ADP-L-glycero-D-manno-heptose 6-epimerase